MQKICGMKQLFATEILRQWRDIKSRLVVEMEESFDKALEKFGETYLKAFMRCDQK